MTSRKSYTSDVSDDEWAFVAPYLTLMNTEAPQRDYSLREVFQRIADEVQAAAPKGARGRRVIAAVQLSDGTIIVAGSRQYLSRAQQAIVASHGAIYAKGLGHAEVTAIEYARYLGYNVEGAHVAASRPICGACYKYLRVFGTIFASVLKK